jgi:hypothetical protein
MAIMTRRPGTGWISCVALTMAALGACRTEQAEPPVREIVRRPVVDAAPIDAPPRGKAAAPSALDVCARPVAEEPLAALCAIGEAADKAHFHCDEPRVLMLCGGHATFACFDSSPPPVTFHAIHDEEGPPVKSGELMPPEKQARKSPVRGVEVQFREIADDRGPALVAELERRFAGWGCVFVDEGYERRHDCGDWQIAVVHEPILDQVAVKAAVPGVIGCGAR